MRKLCNGPCHAMKALDAFPFKDATKTRRGSTCRDCRAVNDRTPERKALLAKQARERREKARREIIEFLGGKCVGCGYDKDWRAMCIDHVHGDGCLERKQYAPNAIYPLVRKNPKRYQLLCANCNQIKAYENGEWGPRDE